MTNRFAYVAFRRTIPRGKFTLTSKDLFFYRTYSKVITDISVGVVSERLETIMPTIPINKYFFKVFRLFIWPPVSC